MDCELCAKDGKKFPAKVKRYNNLKICIPCIKRVPPYDPTWGKTVEKEAE